MRIFIVFSIILYFFSSPAFGLTSEAKTGSISADLTDLAESQYKHDLRPRKEDEATKPITLDVLKADESYETLFLDKVSSATLVTSEPFAELRRELQSEPDDNTKFDPKFTTPSKIADKESFSSPVEFDITGLDDGKAGLKLYNLRASKTHFPSKEKGLWDEGFWQGTWDFVKGEPINDSLLLGMFSHHTSPNRHNETHNLMGIDYKGYSIGTFKNSFSDRTYYAGISRKLYEKDLAENIKFDIKYKFVMMHGYEDHYPDVGGITPLVMPMFGLSMGYTGVDFIAIPAKHPTFSINFRLNLPDKKLQQPI